MKRSPLLVATMLTVMLLLIATISSQTIPVVLAEEQRHSYDTTVSIGGYDWYYWNFGSDKAVVVLFGGHASTSKVWVNELYSDEYTDAKIDFIEESHASGYDILTNKYNHLLYSGSENWLYNVANWLSGHGYNYINLFGFSAGGVVVSYEIQRPHAYMYSAAVVASAPVNWAGHSGIFKSAQTASEATVRTCFIEATGDSYYDQMLLYYNNMVVDKEWHTWNNGIDPHDPFPDTCAIPAHSGEKVSDVAYNWYEAQLPQYSLTVLAYNQYGFSGYVPLYIDTRYVGTTGYTYTVTEGTHRIYVESPLYDGHTHVFQCYLIDGNYDLNNPTTLAVYAGKTVIAYYWSY